jgi:hypothetical protein
LDESRKFEGGIRYYLSPKVSPETNQLVDVLKKQFEKNYGVFIEPIDALSVRELSRGDEFRESSSPFGPESDRTKLVRFMANS